MNRSFNDRQRARKLWIGLGICFTIMVVSVLILDYLSKFYQFNPY
jgi:hypothetical protein